MLNLHSHPVVDPLGLYGYLVIWYTMALPVPADPPFGTRYTSKVVALAPVFVTSKVLIIVVVPAGTV
jgi:hypothetical protein